MANIKLNYDDCTRCNECIDECPMRFIVLDENDYPSFKPDGICISCGHCEAVCPTGAIFVENEQYEALNVNSASRGEFSSLVSKRRSIRRFTPDPVEKSIINEIMEIVRFAPTGSNSQQVHWLIIHEKSEMNKLIDFLIDKMAELHEREHPIAMRYNFDGFVGAWKKHGIDPLFRGAPHLAIAYTPTATPIGLVDSTIALTHFDLALPVFNLGGTWAGFFFLLAKEFDSLESFLGLPQGSVINGGIFFGNPVQKYLRAPKRMKKEVLWK